MIDIDRTDNRRQIALNVARDITAAVVASGSLEGDAGEYTLRTSDCFAKWLETGQIPARPPAA